MPIDDRFIRAERRDQLVAAAVLLAAWQVFSTTSGPYWFPSPSATITYLATETANGSLPLHATITVSEATLGFLIGGVPAVALPFVLRRMPIATAIVGPFMAAGFGMPKLPLAPLFILWFGIGMAPKIALVASSAFFIIYFYALEGVRAADLKVVQLCRVLGASEPAIVWHVVLPSTLPYVFAATRVALPYSMGGAVVAELISADRGLGYLVQVGATGFDTTAVFATLSTIAVIVLGEIAIVGNVERNALAWVVATRTVSEARSEGTLAVRQTPRFQD